MPVNRACLALCLLLSVPAWAESPAAGEDLPGTQAEAPDATKLRCARAYEMSQRLRQDGKLQGAREQALVCAQTACPSVLSGDCATWLVELEEAIPSVVVDVRDARGEAVTEAQVSVDGRAIARALGRALAVDPGTRQFRVVLPGRQTLERSLVVTEGKQRQYLRFELSAEPASAVPTRRPSLSPWAYGAAAAAVMGGVGFGYFGLQGRAEERRLDDCAPRCLRSDVSALGRTYAAADVSLGVGVVALGVFSYLWLTSGDETSRVGVMAGPGGAALELHRRF